ncbi:hypothetical protein ACIBI3_12435 [Actinomadura luteofluorescens]|uniref:pPIWI_RE_Y domain-containing protein n=1 Tax=Actinomadura luteofluorescens TaxID=46163 RepID=UPI003485AB4D
MTTAPVDGSPELLYAVARSFFVLAAQRRTDSFRLPYPDDVQLTLDRVVLDCLRRKEAAPMSVPDLVGRFTEGSTENPPIPMLAGLVPPAAPLVSRPARLPTRTCAELASAGPLGTVAQAAEEALEELAAGCSSTGVFENCRDFLIAHVTLTPREIRAKQASPRFASVLAQVRPLYGEVPDAYVTREMGERFFARCPMCGFPALQLPDERWACESGYCELIEAPERHRVEGTRLLMTPLRLFLALPGGPEKAIRQRLNDAGVATALVSDGLGAYQYTSPTGRTGVLRVYDREQPVLLAAHLEGGSGRAAAPDTAVIPDRVIARRPGYLAMLAEHLPQEAGPVLCSEADLDVLIRSSTHA